ncbi:MAG: methyl-accepting chemotaxis protein [Alphaproteobacteria bacterium]
MRISQLRISHRLVGGFGLVLAIFAVSVAVTMILSSAISSNVRVATTIRVPTAMAGMNLSEAVTNSVANLRGYMLTANDDRRKSWENDWRHIEELRQDIDQRSTNWTSQKNRELWAQVKPVMGELHAIQERVVAQYQANDKDGAVKLLGSEAVPRVNAIADLLYGPIGADGKRSGGMVSNQRVLMDSDIEKVRDEQDNLSIILWVMLAAGIAIGGGLAMATTRSIVRPLAGITNTMESLTKGHLAVEVPGVDRQDELGVAARSVQVFKEGLVERQRLQEEQREAEKKQMEDIARRQRETEERSQVMAQLTQTFDKAVTEVLGAVSSATTELQASATSMASTAEETSRQSTTVAAASEQATANVQTAAAAAEELSNSIGEINRQVSQSSTIANAAVDQAKRTNDTVKGLADAAQKVGEVINLINDIASQTNLLALNATIEAARAGDAGKGFAVVAAEVKTLANQTAKATEDISAQIASIQGATNDAVKAIEGIGTTIGEINDIAASIAAAVEEQGAATSEIARNVQQAASGTKDVSNNIGAVSEAASEVGSAATQVLAASESMSKQAEELKREVQTFLTGIKAA